MSQYEEENDLGRGGGEVSEEAMERAWDAAAERGKGPDSDPERALEDDDEQPV
ncbi:MAG: hypothetical protein M3M94_06655 [Actinomycetota bacterium]|nr:hypothetical protein [Actinomycetota bacterium]